MLRILAPGLLCVLAAAGCGDRPAADGPPPSPTTHRESASAEPSTRTDATAPSTTTPEQAGRAITVAGSDFGPMLFDRSGQAIYLFDKEATSTPECYGACAKAWPPVLTEGPPRAVGAARPGLLGTTRREDGSRQVTYAGHPLYYYAHEDKFEVLCHDVSGFGGLWLVVTPAGEAAD